MTEFAVDASRPVVGSSRNRTPGAVINSIPILHLFLSPPDTPLVNSSPQRVSAHSSTRWLYKVNATLRVNITLLLPTT